MWLHGCLADGSLDIKVFNLKIVHRPVERQVKLVTRYSMTLTLLNIFKQCRHKYLLY